MESRLATILVAATLVAGCGTGASVTISSESIPSTPTAPDGWTSVGAFGGAAANGTTAMSIQLGAGAVALHAVCLGGGTLIVLVSSGALPSGVEPTAVFPCSSGTIAENRFELTGMTIPRAAVFTAVVVEGAGVIRQSAFNVSIEQPKRG